jgi:aminopeptidase
MFNAHNYYKQYLNMEDGSYENTLDQIRDIRKETKGCDKCPGKKELCVFFHHTAGLILQLADFEKKLDVDYFTSRTPEQLLDENHALYREFLPDHYETSYANPAYAVRQFGEGMGQLLSAFYMKYVAYISHAFKHKVYRMEEGNRLFIEVFEHIKSAEVQLNGIKDILNRWEQSNLERDWEVSLKESYGSDYEFYNSTVLEEDLSDLRYLFRLGEYITENELRMAGFLNCFSDEELKTLTVAIAEAYEEGFRKEGKDRKDRTVVRILHNAGQERIVRPLMAEFKRRGLHGFIYRTLSTDVNKQMDYDHRFDNALYLDEEFVRLSVEAYERAAGSCCEIQQKYSGIMYFEKFGEQPFAPQSKPECLKLSEEQSRQFQLYRNGMLDIRDRFIPQTETSFCIIAFPMPEIGEHFEEIFRDIVKINMLDSSLYEKIQKSIIDTLDTGEYVHIKGSKGNATDIRVKLKTLGNPGKETNFVNCTADVNIPLGEVFTSPVLQGTNGVLHLEEVFLDGLKYADLKLTFRDGYVADYSCGNFHTEMENRKYVEENLLFPHKSLPLGEFAIGTNTYAYVMARKYGIVDVLPILIVEKMGPHFAIGDTCFFRSEDMPIYNLIDGKEIVAKDNERSLLRKTNPAEAYLNVHTDITLPYDSLEAITVITGSGQRTEILRHGRFVLAGTEKLNEPFGE